LSSCFGVRFCREHLEHAAEHLLSHVVVGKVGHRVGIAELAPEVAQQIRHGQSNAYDDKDQPLKIKPGTNRSSSLVTKFQQQNLIFT
jgi:hypothetical protein